MIKLSRNFNLDEFLNLKKYPYNEIPTQCLVNLQYGVATILQPLRDALGCPIIINSGYRCPQVNKQVGGVANSQHMSGCAADIRPADLKKFWATAMQKKINHHLNRYFQPYPMLILK